jgi:hypothetical protein
MNTSNLVLYFTSSKGVIQWDWKGENLPGETPSPKYKAYNYQWYVPKKSEFTIISDLPKEDRQQVKDELWASLEAEIDYMKAIRKIHNNNRKNN